ncbi:MAG: hypothetical protein HYV97_10815 [Bdellovibrio sp.]|nr:hypothetical protein [Bdellovibrio sp.]
MDQITHSWDFFCKSLPPGLRDKLEAVMAKGFSLCLVGGASRQWILNQSLPLDLDFEIRPSENKIRELHPQEIEQTLSDVFGDIRPMPFHVFIVETKDIGHTFQLEFSLPRREIYSSIIPEQGFGHSDFKVQIVPSMSYAQSFARRDFSINAIGLEFRPGPSGISMSLQDPYQGLEDLAVNVLRPIGDDFYYDPVRFLRMIRFQLSLRFSLHPSLKQNMGKFRIRQITSHYFLKEAFKTEFGDFIRLFFQYADEYHLEVPSILQSFRCLSSLPWMAVPTPHSALQLAVIIAEMAELRRQEILKEAGKLFEDHLGLKNKTIQKLILAKKSEEIIIKLQQLDSSLPQNLSEAEFFQHPLVRDLGLVIKAYSRYPDIFEERWSFLKKTGHELQIIKRLSQGIANIELPGDCDDQAGNRDLRKIMLAMKSLGMFPRIAGL